MEILLDPVSNWERPMSTSSLFWTRPYGPRSDLIRFLVEHLFPRQILHSHLSQKPLLVNPSHLNQLSLIRLCLLVSVCISVCFQHQDQLNNAPLELCSRGEDFQGR